jgi:23S rRNA (uracil1939-C5)-methyltransferase
VSENHLLLQAESLASGGDAVARDADGRVVFVRGAAPGERIRARVLEERPSFARAVVEEVLEPSADRERPCCPSFGACGGCQWQHVAYDAQLTAKRRIVDDALERIGGIDVRAFEVVPAQAHYGYRNRVELGPGPGPTLSLGYVGVDGSHVAVDSCDLLPDRFREAPRRISGALRYLEGSSRLGIERAALRISESGGSCSLELWTRPGPFPRGVAATTLGNAVDVDTVSRVLFDAERGRHAVRGVETLAGSGRWEERLSGYRYSVSPASFFQVNTAQAEKLVEVVVDSLEPDPDEPVLDLYCGVGTFTLPLAASGARVLAVEASGSAIKDLERNLQDARLAARILPGEASRVLEDERPSVRSSVVDPPRAGLSVKALESLAAATRERIVYVSCDPSTFARDAGRLSGAGFALGRVTPVDLFPQTYHVELVGVFDRR